MIKKTLLTLALLLAQTWAFNTGETLSNFTLSDDEGGYVTDEAFDLSTLDKKLYIMFYVDPDESDMNDHVGQALKEIDFPKENFGSIAAINMAGTWKPNFIINSILKSKQEEFPSTIYIRDNDYKVLKEWDLADDSSNILLFNKARKLLFIKRGKLSQTELNTLIQAIRDNING